MHGQEIFYPPGNERKRTIGKLNSKELARLHSDKRFLAFAKDQIIWYRQSNPYINFYVPEWFILKMNHPQLSVKRATIHLDGFAFLRKATISNEK